MKIYFSLFVCLLLTFSEIAHADRLVDGQITNTATASFEDSTSVSRAVSSNTVSATALQAGGLAMANGASKTVTRGSRIVFSHSVMNKGGSPETFQLSEVNSGTFSMEGASFYVDADGDGHPDSSSPITGLVVVVPGATFRFVAVAMVPRAAVIGGTNVMVVSLSTRTGIVKATSTDKSAVGPD